ncbi:hypothetical protein K440DRAFT_642022 [Wilcoxina mikolae CBS 423.85]|nr:hypothetical protein K440DRAFT_642022 [Wilcoxina mikolae CBS 423.85]
MGAGEDIGVPEVIRVTEAVGVGEDIGSQERRVGEVVGAVGVKAEAIRARAIGAGEVVEAVEKYLKGLRLIKTTTFRMVMTSIAVFEGRTELLEIMTCINE